MMLDAVAFEVSGRVLLAPLTVTLPAQGVVGLVGQNGSGKSTLLKLLARQQPPTQGRISYAGIPLLEWAARDFARSVAYLPQQAPPAVGLTTRELVSLGRYPWHGALGRFSLADRRKVDEALLLTSTLGYEDRLVETLSGGERQRVWLAMLIAQDARLLLLDEPLSALDPAHQVEVMKLVRRISLETGVAVIVVLHDINLAARYCDRILALKAGDLIVDGPPDVFMTAAQLEMVYDVAMGVFPHPVSGTAVAYVRD